MATIKQKQAIAKVVENGGNVSRAMIDANYSPATAKTPQKLTESKAWKEIMEEALPDSMLAEKHKELLNSSHLDHMTFPLGPKDEDDKEKYIEKARAEADKKGREYVEIEYITDKDIREMLEDVNCKVRRIVHRETARDVYFWSADNMARDKALDKAYKLKGSYAPDKSISIKIELDEESRNKASEAIKQVTG